MKLLFLIIILIIVSLLFLCNFNFNNLQQEEFTPFIREKYRPIMRNTRIMSEGFKTNVENLFRKFKIL